MREAKDPTAFKAHTAKAKELLIDGTEMAVERPADNDYQKAMYSGKQKTHTASAVVISDKKRYIYYVSSLYEGSTVDITVLRSEFSTDMDWFDTKKVVVDLGYTGILNDYKFGELMIGNKRPRKKKNEPRVELTNAQKEHNKEVSRQRIYVEHAIGEMKRYRVLINRSRIKCYKRKDQEIGICAALANYKNRKKSSSTG